MLEENINIKTKNLPIELKSKDTLIINGKAKSNLQSNNLDFDIEYKEITKNVMISFILSGKNKDPNKDIIFYFRVVDNQNYCSFTIRDGKDIKFSVVWHGKENLKTDWYTITNDNLFIDKSEFILAFFEEKTTVLINGNVILDIDDTPEVEGKFGIHFRGDTLFDMKFDKFHITQEIINFQPIIEMPKRSDVYFMQANDFYEQNRYEIALRYYKKGLLYGLGDAKIYNRIGNLYFLIEQYDLALEYYDRAYTKEPDNIEYKESVARSFAKLSKFDLAIQMFEEVIESGSNNLEVLIDYGSILIEKKEYEKALEFLQKAYKQDQENAAILSKRGKCLVILKKIKEGQQDLLKAAKIYAKSDPSASAIILKYSLQKRKDKKSLIFLCELLEEKGEFGDVYELIKSSMVEIQVDDDIMRLLINAELNIGLFEKALEELDFYKDKEIPTQILALKIEIFIKMKRYEEANIIVNKILQDAKFDKVGKNQIIYLKLKILSKSGIKENYDDFFNELTKKKTFYIESQIEYAKILVDAKRFEEALTIFEKLEKKISPDAEFYYNYGLAYLGIREFYFAKNMLIHANSMSPQNHLIIFALASALFYAKDYYEAKQLIVENYSNIPEDGRTDNLLGNIYLSLEDIPNAQKFYYKALEIDPENEEFALNLAESFYKMKDYESMYMITKQLVKKSELDRAKSLHLRAISHLFHLFSCAKCGREWKVPKNSKDEKITKEQIASLHREAPAGICPSCKKIYCKECVDGLPEIDAVCPDCNKILTFNFPVIRIIAGRILRREND